MGINTHDYQLSANNQKENIESDEEHFKYSNNPIYDILADKDFSTHTSQSNSIEIELLVPTYYVASFSSDTEDEFSIPKNIAFELNEATVYDLNRLNINLNNFTPLTLISANPKQTDPYYGMSIKIQDNKLKLMIKDEASAEKIARHLLRNGQIFQYGMSSLKSYSKKNKFDNRLNARFYFQENSILSIKLKSYHEKYPYTGYIKPKYFSIPKN